MNELVLGIERVSVTIKCDFTYDHGKFQREYRLVEDPECLMYADVIGVVRTLENWHCESFSTELERFHKTLGTER